MRVAPATAFVSCTLIWGTTWLAIKLGYEGLPAVWGASLRFLIAGLLLLPFAVSRSTRPQSARAAAVILFVGTFLFGLDYGLIYWGEQALPSGLTAVLFATTPLFVAAYSTVILPNERLSPRQLFGILVGFAGVVAISANDLSLDATLVGPILAICGSAAAAAISTVVVRRWGHDIPPRTMNAYAMLVGATLLAVASRLLGEHPRLPTTTASTISLLYLALVGSVVSFILYWDLLRAWPAHRASLVTLIVPVVALLTGSIALLVASVPGEGLSPLQWAGSAIVLAGVALSLHRAKARPPAIAKAAGGN